MAERITKLGKTESRGVINYALTEAEQLLWNYLRKEFKVLRFWNNEVLQSIGAKPQTPIKN